MLFIVERGPNAGTRIPLTIFPVNIGRDPSNDIVMNDEECSRFHVRIKRRGRLVICEDLESRNGCYINGDRIMNAVIKNGDKILIGSTELTFVTSESEIELANEIVNFDMLVAEELGLKGPIDVNVSKKAEPAVKALRLNHLSVLNHSNHDAQAIKKIYEMHSNLVVISDLEEAAKSCLKHVGQLMPSAARAAFFVWSKAARQLIPLASRHYQKKLPFLLSHRTFEDVITRKQGVLLKNSSPNTTQDGRTRAILPMLNHESAICVLHIESDAAHNSFPIKELEYAQVYLNYAASCFDSLLLKRELDSWLAGMIETMIATVEAKDTYTRGHSERVSKYSLAIADELKLDRDTKTLLMVSSLCHDIGKIGVPDTILKKASLLSADEYDEMKLHPSIGADIMAHMPNAKRFISGIKYHHEKWDGTGYPEGLAGEDIPFFGRIVAIADVYDAMVSGRSYSGFLNQTDALDRLMEEKELFDPEILKAFVKAHDKGTLTLKTDTLNQAPISIVKKVIISNIDPTEDPNAAYIEPAPEEPPRSAPGKRPKRRGKKKA